jgi:hypothetical protein
MAHLRAQRQSLDAPVRPRRQPAAAKLNNVLGFNT